MKAHEVKPPIRIFKFTDKFNAKNLTEADLKRFSADLEVAFEEVELYFRHYSLNKRYPIKTLDRFDLDFVELLFEWKKKNLGKKVSLASFIEMTAKAFDTYDQSLITKKLQNYMMYEDFLLTPYILYGNSEPPYHYILTNHEVQLQLSRLALGEFSSRYEKFVPANVKIRALELLMKMRDSGDGKFTLVDSPDATFDASTLSTRELLEIIKYTEGKEVKRGKGQPSGDNKVPGMTDFVEESEYETVKKRRGRPRTGQYDKAQTLDSNAKPYESQPQAKRRPGRPRKDSTPEEPIVKRKRGRPRKEPVSEEGK